MFFSVIYDSEINTIMVKTVGSMTVEHVKTLVDREIEMITEYPGSYIISDHSESDGKGLSTNDMWTLAKECVRLGPHLEGSKAALILKGDVEYGLGRMFQTILEMRVSFEIEVVRNMEDAKAWLRKPLAVN
ncbi:MAG: hypothetical protein NE330_15215 [Lentisphaeraceae bacterium]|nr:hypothetical protein [Lentisphaeraceae bacterium]